jgi:sugar phosphate isomerase/epimerase
MPHSSDRREFIRQSAAAVAGVSLTALTADSVLAAKRKPLFTISLAEWSLHKTLFAKKLDNLDFPRTAKNEFGIDAVEYVNQFFKDKAQDRTYLSELKKRTRDLGVQNVLIMCDGEGFLADSDNAKRQQAVENHKKWVEAAKFLGCHSIRVNAYGKAPWEERMKLAAEGLSKLTAFAAPHKINVIVENHGSLSSNGEWLAGVMKMVGHPRCGTLPDFGNFRLDDGTEYDRYKGVQEMMPFAKGVSAKAHEFDAEGNETQIDFRRLMKIVLAAKYHGRVGIEFEGSKMDESEGIRATKRLLEKVQAELSGGA